MALQHMFNISNNIFKQSDQRSIHSLHQLKARLSFSSLFHQNLPQLTHPKSHTPLSFIPIEMQLTSLLLLALGATKLATPIDISDASSDNTNGTTSSSTEHRLEKRGTYGWIASYSDLDFKCRGGYADNRPEISTDCVNFTPVGGHIGVCLSPPTSPSSLSLPPFPFPCPSRKPLLPACRLNSGFLKASCIR